MAKKPQEFHIVTTVRKPGHGVLMREISDHTVRVMCQSGGYSMVRRKGCAPFVVPTKDLRETEGD